MANGPFLELRRNTVLEYLEKYPDTSSRSLARMICRDNPGLFKDVEDARTRVRLYRGQLGNNLRSRTKIKKYFTYEVQST
jgi:hypothetical protein